MRGNDSANGPAKNELYTMFLHTLNMLNQITKVTRSEVLFFTIALKLHVVYTFIMTGMQRDKFVRENNMYHRLVKCHPWIVKRA